MKEQQGSITIEAAFIASFLLLILAGVMKESINLCQSVRQETQSAELDNLKPTDYFRKVQIVRRVTGG
ncbi:hypothetical protein FACS1894111_08370 [Clostridia bacterium]|nr:hypothetical protein FACS1894111_08370 [Clostridia bacterium]